MYLAGLLEPKVVVDLAPDDDALYLACCQAIASLKLDAKAHAIRPRRVTAAGKDDPSSRQLWRSMCRDMPGFHACSSSKAKKRHRCLTTTASISCGWTVIATLSR